MKTVHIIGSSIVFALLFCSLAVYLSIGWWQNISLKVNLADFIYLIVFTAIGLLAVSIGIAMFWETIKKVFERKPKT